MSQVVLDASALLAMLRNEPGAAKVASVIGAARMTAVNYAEVIGYLDHAGMTADKIDALLRPLPLTVTSVDAGLARLAGGLRKATADAGLSLGDRFCLAHAMSESLPAWTADRNWQTVAERLGAEIVLIR